MKLTKEELLALYQPARPQSARKAECLTEDELTRAAAEDLSQKELRRVAAHLVTCVDCAEEYRIVRPLNAWMQQVAATSGETAPAVMFDRIEAGSTPKQSWRERFEAIVFQGRAPLAVAAGFMVVVLGLGIWIALMRGENRRIASQLDKEVAERERASASAGVALEETRQQLEEARRQVEEMRNSNSSTQQEPQIAELRRSLEDLSRPLVNVPIIELEPQGSRRGETAASTIRIPSAASLFTLVLNMTGEQSYSGYALEILDNGGRLAWSARGLQRSQQNTFTIALPRRQFPAGQYRINLYGLNKNRKDLIEDYPVRIEYK